MEILTPTKSEQLPAAFNDPSGTLLRPTQMAEHYNDLRVAKSDMDNPKVQDKAAVRQRVGNLQRQYESQAPRPITDGAVKDALAKEEKQLLSEIVPSMLSQEEMRKNPPGAVDEYRRREGSTEMKKKILRWKKIKILQNADNSDPDTWDRDAANLERYRPQGAQDRLRADAQITGKMTFGNVPEENWKQTFGSVNPETSALEQAKRAEMEKLSESIGLTMPPPLTSFTKPGRKPLSDEQRRIMGENLARGRAAKKALLQEKGA